LGIPNSSNVRRNHLSISNQDQSVQFIYLVLISSFLGPFSLKAAMLSVYETRHPKMFKVMLTIFPVFVQQQHPAADRSSGGSPMSLVHPKLYGALPASQTPKIITPKVRAL
jgi:hypothetical protein